MIGVGSSEVARGRVFDHRRLLAPGGSMFQYPPGSALGSLASTPCDVALRVVGRGLDPDETTVGEVGSSDIVSLTPDDDLDEALRLMARAQVRRLPIVVRGDVDLD